jgi:hypothetical protein
MVGANRRVVVGGRIAGGATDGMQGVRPMVAGSETSSNNGARLSAGAGADLPPRSDTVPRRPCSSRIDQ